jgi:ABC-type amino acid transport substrate-binding protein
VPGPPPGRPGASTTPEHSVPQDEPPLPAIPGYEVLGVLGRGAMGVVYQARQVRLQRLVALKTILAGSHAGEAERARFRTEAEAVARLQHPNIIQIYEIGEHESKPFLSLEFCPGGSLEKQLGGKPLEPSEAARLVATLARAMQAAHHAQVIHRDLKPGNVLLAADGTPKIGDFGLAKKLDEAGQTRSGAVLGTPSYMAPEQASGKAKDIGPAADVWALGAILYECLTGQPPFRAGTYLDTLMLVVSDEPPPVRRLQPAVPRDLETVCHKCLHKDRTKRYATAAALADDLDRFLAGQPVLARPVTAWQRLGHWCRRNPVLAGVSATAAVLLVVVLLLLAHQAGGKRDVSLLRVQRAGKWVVATDPTYPPMEFEERGELKGFDIDLASHLAQRLGVRLEIIRVGWHWKDLVARLNAGEFDSLLSTITVNEDRQKDVDFVDYLPLRHVYVGRPGMAIRTEADLAGRVIAVQADTNALRLVRLLQQRIALKEVKVFPETIDPFDAVLRGDADVTYAHEPVAHYHADRDKRLVVLGTVGHGMNPDPVGIAFRKQDKALQAAVAEAIKGLREDGIFERVLETWFPR